MVCSCVCVGRGECAGWGCVGGRGCDGSVGLAGRANTGVAQGGCS